MTTLLRKASSHLERSCAVIGIQSESSSVVCSEGIIGFSAACRSGHNLWECGLTILPNIFPQSVYGRHVKTLRMQQGSSEVALCFDLTNTGVHQPPLEMQA